MISLREYTTSRVELDRGDLDYVLDLIKASGAPGEPKIFESLAPTSEDDVYEVRPGPFVGRIGLPSGLVLDIGSRFDFGDLVTLIRFSGRAPIRLDALRTDAAEATLIVDLIATAFTRELERIVGQGLAKGYVQRRFREPPYPGTIDLTHWIGRQSARADRLSTAAPRLTVSVPANQILAAAIDALTSIQLSAETRGRLSRVASAFRAVQRAPISWSDVGTLSLTRLTTRYADALGLAERILRARSLGITGSGLAGASIAFAMPNVWESCVTRWVEQTWGTSFRTVAGYGFPLTRDGSITAVADVLVLEGGRPVALYDAKYKDIAKAPSTGDLYQMVTYCERLGLKTATLAYPAAPHRSSVQVGDTVIRVVGVKDVVEQLGAASDAIRSIAV